MKRGDMAETDGVMQTCKTCEGKGHEQGYGVRYRCYDCVGSGKQLTLRERELLEAMFHAIDVRERVGREA